MAGLITRQIGGVTVADFVDTAILDQEKLQQIGRELRALPDQPGVENILIDMRRVGLLTSSMIGEFIKLRQKCGEAKVGLKMCGLSKDLTKLFKKMKLHKLFAIYTSRERALKAFGVTDV